MSYLYLCKVIIMVIIMNVIAISNSCQCSYNFDFWM